MNIKKIFKSPYFWGFLLGIASLHLIKEMALRNRRAPDPLVYVDDWQLIDQNGEPFRKTDLSGKIFIVDYFFTSCPTICPKLTKSMKEVYKRFSDKKDQVHFLSITVDPTTDDPKRLTKFMHENNIHHKNWHCLTGKQDQIYDVVVNKMKVHFGEKQPVEGQPNRYDIPHLAHLALFDQNGDLRGLFKTEPVELASLVRAANFLLEKQ